MSGSFGSFGSSSGREASDDSGESSAASIANVLTGDSASLSLSTMIMHGTNVLVSFVSTT
jgi:hypothetical protein